MNPKPSIRIRLTKLSPAPESHRKSLAQVIKSQSPSTFDFLSNSPLNNPTKTTLCHYFANSPPIISSPEDFEEDSVIKSLNQLLRHAHCANESLSKIPSLKSSRKPNQATPGTLVLHKRPKIQLKIQTKKRQSSIRPNPLFS